MSYQDALFSAAFRMKDEEPWKILDENDLFHFVAKSGKDYYCMVTGFAGQHCALTLYEGVKGFSTRRYITDSKPEEARKDPFFLCSQECIQVSIEDDKEQVPPATLKEERAYAKRNGFRLGGKKGYCAFLDYTQEYLPDELEEEDQEDLEEGLEVLSDLVSRLKGGEAQENLGLCPGFSIPDIKREGDGFVYSTLPYPRYVEPEWPVGQADEFSLSAIRSHKKTFSVSMRITYIPSPVYDAETARALIPAALLIISNKDGQIFPLMAECSFKKNPDAFLEGINEAFQTLDLYPKYINVDDDRTENFLRSFSKDTGIPLVRVHQIADIDEILERFFDELQHMPDFDEEFDEEEFQEEFENDPGLAQLTEVFASMSDEEIASMPLNIKKDLMGLLKTPLFDEELKERLKRLL